LLLNIGHYYLISKCFVVIYENFDQPKKFIKGHKSHDIINQRLEILKNIAHRGAVGADLLAGDGAGIIIHKHLIPFCVMSVLMLVSPYKHWVNMAWECYFCDAESGTCSVLFKLRRFSDMESNITRQYCH
jgi:hypothetical protein